MLSCTAHFCMYVTIGYVFLLNNCAIKQSTYKTTSNMTMHVLFLIKMVWINDIETNSREEK